MRRSQSYCSLGKGESQSYDEEEGDGGSVINAYESQESYSILRWPSNKNRKPMVNFSAACVLVGTPDESLEEIKKYHLGFKFVKTECRLVRNILNAHGFKETSQNSLQFNLMWTGTHLKPYTLRALSEFQKVNHFPRSYELTRKDRLYKNIQRMQHAKGTRHFDFIPQSFVLTSELNDFYAAFLKDRGPWIVKPVASSRGRGIYLIGHPNQIPVDDNVLVCKYINNPMLINGYKFDCRLYVTVTCYDPLRLYLYEEGLARFSTVKYERHGHINNQWMHLTNYSVNKNSEDYIRCEDPEVDDYGSKWSFSAMLRCLKECGKDVEALMARIEDVIIKTIISGEMAIATACKMFVPYRSNCFELFGFDVLVDENLKPWLLEVNLSPSLACDSPLDLKIKSNLITDLFNLTGFVADDPTLKKPPKLIMEAKKKQRQTSANFSSSELKSLAMKSINKLNDGLTNEERKILRETKEESKRCGGFVRIYPSPESWELYGSLQEHQTTHNRMLHAKLYPELWRASQRPQSATYIARARNFSSINKPIFSQASEGSLSVSGQNFHQRFQIYQKKLASWSDYCQYPDNNQGTLPPAIPHASVSKSQLIQGQLLNPALYEEKLLLKESTESLNTDIIKNGQYLNKFQARCAFALYLKRVQSRLIEEIRSSHHQPYEILSTEEVIKQEKQINLIHKFLMKSAVNLTNPIDVAVPKKNLPLKERKKILAHQLVDFVKVYGEETNILLQIDVISMKEETANSISDESFNKFLISASECELEDILTLFTRHNKSASIFLGAKRDKKVKTVSENEENRKRSEASTNLNSSHTAVSMDSEEKRHSVDMKDSGTEKSGVRNQMKHAETGSESNNIENKYHLRHLSADTSPIGLPGKQVQPGSKPRLRSLSLERGNKLSTICAYTGANAIMKLHRSNTNDRSFSKRVSSARSRPDSSTSSSYRDHVFGADDPKLRRALQKLSLKQAERTYSSNNISPTTHNSKLLNNKIRAPSSESNNLSGHNIRVYNKLNAKSGENCGQSSDSLESFIKYGQQFLADNKKSLSVDRNNYKQQTASTQTLETCVSKFNSENSTVANSNYFNYPDKHSNIARPENDTRLLSKEHHVVYNQPRPPDKRKPVIKKQINPRKVSRVVVKR